MSKLDYCFEPYKSPHVHAIKERICDEHVRQHSTSKKSIFIIYLLKDEQELSLGMLIRLQHIYNFWLFHAVILSFLDVLQSFYSYFLVLIYWHSAHCQLLFSACFLHRRKSIPNGVQTQWNFLWNFFDQKTSSGPKKHLGGAPRGAQPTRVRLEAQARPGRLCPPRVPPDRLFTL